MLTLFPDEKIVSESNDKSVVLTSHRICYEKKDWGKSYNQSIMLEHITSCENHYSNNLVLMYLGLAGVILGGLGAVSKAEPQELFGLGFIIGVVLLLVYWLTRASKVVVASPSTKMEIITTGMSKEKIMDFINTIEQTKHKRILSVSGKSNIIG